MYAFVSDEDEVGDRITVRSDEELKAMLSYVSVLVVWMWMCVCPFIVNEIAF